MTTRIYWIGMAVVTAIYCLYGTRYPALLVWAGAWMGYAYRGHLAAEARPPELTPQQKIGGGIVASISRLDQARQWTGDVKFIGLTDTTTWQVNGRSYRISVESLGSEDA